MTSIMTLHGLDRHLHGSRFSLHVRKLTFTGFIYASLVGLTGCATSAELESLRAEVAQANATVVAEAEVSRTQCELASLKAAAKPLDTFSKPRTQPTTPLTKATGYKWGRLPQY